MRFNQIKISGLERVFDGYRISANENRKAFTYKLTEFLNHTMISIHISEITGIELFYLKKFCSKLHILKNEYRNFINEKTNEKMHNELEGMIALYSDMVQDTDIDSTKINIDNILPIGCISYDVIAVFKGASILSITSPFMEKIFTDNNELFEAYVGDKMMENKISQLFYNEFYLYMSRKMTEVDLVTSFMTNNKFYQYADGICSLAHINTVFGPIDFFGSTSDKLNKQIASIKEVQKSVPYILNDSTYLTFVLNTTFGTFLSLYYNTNFIIDHQDLQVVFNGDDMTVSEDLYNKYYVRISNIYSKIRDYKTEIVKDNKIDLNQFNFILNGNKIKYCIQVSMDDINTLSDILSGIDEYEQLKTEITKTSNMIKKLIN